jgi:hypothetical protein
LSKEHHSSTGSLVWFGAYLPVVLLEAPLFEYHIDSNGNEMLEERNHMHVCLYENESIGLSPIIVQIVTSKAVPEFATSAFAEAQAVAQIIRDNSEEFWVQSS